MNPSAAGDKVDELEGILRSAVEEIASAPLPAGVCERLIERAAKWGPPAVRAPAKSRTRLHLIIGAALALVLLLAAAIALVGGLPQEEPIAAAPKENQTEPQASPAEKDAAALQSFGMGVTLPASDVSPDKRLGGIQPSAGFGTGGLAPQGGGAVPAGAGQQPDKTDQECMVGNWFIMNDDSQRKGEMWVITEHNILMYAKHGGANSQHYAHRLDASKNPKQIDIAVTLVKGTPVGVIEGLYALDGEELRLCLAALGKVRPAKFPEKPAPGEVLVLQRAAHGASPPKAK